MTKDDLTIEIKELEATLNLAKADAIKRYCDANNPYKIGDKFTDHIGAITIQKIDYYRLLGGDHTCMFFGPELKKDGTPKNDARKKRWAWQSNDISTKL